MKVLIGVTGGIAAVASISANNDREIGKIMAEAFNKVGKDGVITVEEGKSLETDIDVVEGMQFDKGYLSPYFCTNNESMEVVLEDCYILIYEKKVTVSTISSLFYSLFPRKVSLSLSSLKTSKAKLSLRLW